MDNENQGAASQLLRRVAKERSSGLNDSLCAFVTFWAKPRRKVASAALTLGRESASVEIPSIIGTVAMRLEDLEQIDDSDFPRWRTRVEDAAGTEPFELTVAGPRKLVEQVFADANLDLSIDSAGDDAPLLSEYKESRSEQRQAAWRLAALDDLDTLLKPPPRTPRVEASVFAAARPVSGDGTPFAFAFSGFFVPTGVSLFLAGPFVITTFAGVTPATGDQDLFLHLFAPTGPVVAASRFGGTTRDTVAFGVPFFPFVPVFQIFGFTAGVCSTFAALGV